MQDQDLGLLSLLQAKKSDASFLDSLRSPVDLERLTQFQGFGLGGPDGASDSFLSRFRLQINASKASDDLLALVAPALRGGSAAQGIVSGIRGVQGGLDSLGGTFRAISNFNGYLRKSGTTQEVLSIARTVGIGGTETATFANVIGNAVSLSNLGPTGLTASQVTGVSVALSALSDVAATFATQDFGSVALSGLTDTAATAATQTYGSVALSNLSDVAATFAQQLYGSISLSNLSDVAGTAATQTYGPVSLSNLTNGGATAATKTYNSVALSNLVDSTLAAASHTFNSVKLSNQADIGGAYATKLYNSVRLSNLLAGPLTASSQTYDLVRLSNLTSSAAQFVGGVIQKNNLQDVALSASTVTFNTVKVNGNGASAATYTANGPISFSNAQDTGATASFSVTQDALAGTPDYGGAIINGYYVDFGQYISTDHSKEAVASWMAGIVNSTGGLKDEITATTSGGTITISTNRARGTDSVINISQNIVGADTTNPFTVGNWTGTDAFTNFGTITINNVATVIGQIRNRDYTQQTAALYVASQINANGASTVTADIDFSNRLVLTQKTTGSGGKIIFQDYGGGINGSSTSLNGGTLVGGSNSGTSQNKFGSVTINGVTTNFGTYTDANATSLSGAQYIANAINANTSNTVTASVSQIGQVILTQKTAGAAYGVTVSSYATGGGQADAGFLTGTWQNGTNPSTAITNFGSVTINGVTTNIGSITNNQYTDDQAAQYVIDKINANAANTVIAAKDSTNHIILTHKSVGSAYSVNISAIGNTANGTATGLSIGTTSNGTDVPTTDFGSIKISGISTYIGKILNGSYTPTTAAQYIASKINNNSQNVVTASASGGKLTLTHKQVGAGFSFDVQDIGNTADNTSTGLTTGMVDNGTDATFPTTYFGIVNINGITTNLGSFVDAGDGSYTSANAAQFVANALNANAANTVIASVENGDKIRLTQKQQGSAFTINVTNKGNTNNLTDTGLTTGIVSNGVDPIWATTDFGSVTINGVTTNLGVIQNYQYTTVSAAQFIRDKINANVTNTVTASISGDKLVLTQKTQGSAYAVDVTGVGGTANGASTGLTTGTWYGTDNLTATTDFGSITIDGVTTNLGVVTNHDYTTTTAAQYIASLINANLASTVTASTTGDQLVLTQKNAGSSYSFDVTNAGGTTNGASTGLTTGLVNNGSDVAYATTDFGSITINGVTTNLGSIINDNYTTTSAAQYIADQLNANLLNEVTASISGDQLVLVQKTAGVAYGINVTDKGSTADGQDTGLTVGNTANGTDAVYATTDFGSVTINGETVNLGTIQNNLYTTATAAQYVRDLLNANLTTVTASVSGDQLALTQNTAGSANTINVTDKGNTADGQDTGLTVGNVANGADAVYATTDFGSVTINGETVNLGTIQNNLYTTTTAANYIAGLLNANLTTVTASVGGDQLVLTQNSAGSANTINVTDKGNTADGQDTGLTVGNTANGTDIVYATTDFGSVTINGETVNLGTVQNNLYTTTTAANYIAGLLNASLTTVTASVSGDQLVLTQNSAGSANTINVTDKGNTADGQDTGLTVGNVANGTDAVYAQTDFGSFTVNGETVNLGSIQNNLYTSQTAAQYIAGLLNANLSTVTASVSGDQITLTQNTAGSTHTINVTQAGNTADGQTTGFSLGTTANGTDAPATTDFGAITINGVTTNLGTIQNNQFTPTTAAQYLANQLNANSANTVAATAQGDKLVLTSKTAGSGGTIQVTNNGNTSDGISTGLTVGATQNGEDGNEIFGGSSEEQGSVRVKRSGFEEVVDDRLYERLGEILHGINGSLDRVRAELGAKGVSQSVREVENQLLELTGNQGKLAPLGITFQLKDQGLSLNVDENQLLTKLKTDPDQVSDLFHEQADQLAALSGSLAYEAGRVAEMSQDLPELAAMVADLKQAQLLDDLIKKGLSVTRKLSTSESEEEDDPLKQEEKKKQASPAHSPVDFRLQQMQAIAQTVQPATNPSAH